MSDPTAEPSHPSSFRLLVLLFIASGACGLTYQVLWLRSLSLVFGVTVYAASTVLAAFMSGLALGSYLGGPLRSRIVHPIAAFGVAEIGIGLSALTTPFGLRAADSVYSTLYQASPESLGLLTAGRLACSMVVLLVPTLLMGLTLPLISGSALVRGARFGSRIGLLYAANTAGAMAGVIVTGFLLIGSLGMRRTFLLAAAVNVLTGLVAIWLSRTVTEAPIVASPVLPERHRTGSTAAAPVSFALELVVFLSGLASVALEIVWFRILLQFVPATSYAFTAMLASVLAGIALGGAAAARLLRRDRDLTRALARVSIATGTAVLGSLMFLAWSYQAGWQTSGTLQSCAAAILPASFCMGLAFPLALRLATSRPDLRGSASRAVGRLYAVNVVGAIAGALLGGFVILPALGSRNSAILLSSIYAASGVLLVVAHPDRRRILPRLSAGLALFLLTTVLVPDPFAAALTRRHGEGYREIFRADGMQTAATVQADDRKRVLFLDGVHQADDTLPIVRTHWQIGHLPVVLHPRPADALVVGLGGGATPGAISQHAGMRVHVIELSDSVRRAAAYFGHVNYNILAQPNLRLRMDDGRNFLKFTRERFDIITADVVHPTYAGAGTLYAREYFELVRGALRDRGLVLQWIGQRPDAHYRVIMRTFLDVFPHATLWVDGTLMVGSVEPLRVDLRRVEQEREDPRTRAALDAIGLTSGEVLRDWFRAGPDEMRAFVGPGPILTDDRPILEYHRSMGRTPMVDLSGMRRPGLAP